MYPRFREAGPVASDANTWLSRLNDFRMIRLSTKHWLHSRTSLASSDRRQAAPATHPSGQIKANGSTGIALPRSSRSSAWLRSEPGALALPKRRSGVDIHTCRYFNPVTMYQRYSTTEAFNLVFYVGNAMDMPCVHIRKWKIEKVRCMRNAAPRL